MKKSSKNILFFVCFLVVLSTLSASTYFLIKGINKKPVELKYYDISNEYSQDLNINKISQNSIIDKSGSKKNGSPYLAHPDILAIENKNKVKLLNYYVDGHGKGQTKLKKAEYTSEKNTKDLIWKEVKLNDDFKKTEETPTLFTLNFKNGEKKYLFISGRPGWNNLNNKGQGFYASLSNDGEEWSPFENFYGEDAKRNEFKAKKGQYNAIVAMASMIQVMENGEFVDKWDFLFHDYSFRIFITRLSFIDGKMFFSKPEVFMKKYEDNFQKKYSLCEPCMFRNPKKQEQIIVLFRANKKISNSFISISNDNGKTFETPKELPNYLTGERHKVTFLSDGRIAISFRKIDFYKNIKKPKNFYSHGTMLWIGELKDIFLNTEKNNGILLKAFHSYLKDEYTFDSNADTGYCGLYSTKNDKGEIIIIISSYGKFLKNDINNTIIASKIINLNQIEEMITNKKLKLLTK